MYCAVHMDGPILATWPCRAGWAICDLVTENTASRYLEQLTDIDSKAAEAAWASTAHPLEPLWSHGLAPALQPHDSLLPVVSKMGNSHMGIGFQTLQDVELSP